MKYGLLLHDKSDNLGDVIQAYAIECLYEKLGIPKSKIQYITLEELATYSGDYVVLPMNTYGFEETLNLSERIIPIFLGYNSMFYLKKEYVNFLNRFSPIGCRDEITLKNMREHGIEAYITGCFTLTLDKRTSIPEDGVYYFVDIPSSLLPFIPKDVANKSIFISNILELQERQKLNAFEFYRYTIERFKEYKTKAKAVITSRLHCASPCLAMGIPVIIVKQNVDANLSWIDRFLPIYTEDNFKNIDWNPKSIEIENIKKEMITLFETRLKKIRDERESFFQFSFEYENRNKTTINQKIIEKLDRIVKCLNKTCFTYGIWSAGPGGFLVYQIIKERYPNANLKFVIDRYKSGKFYDVDILSPDNLSLINIDYVFVCTYAGRVDAVNTLESLGRIRNENYAFLLSKEDKQDEYYDGY